MENGKPEIENWKYWHLRQNKALGLWVSLALGILECVESLLNTWEKLFGDTENLVFCNIFNISQSHWNHHQELQQLSSFVFDICFIPKLLKLLLREESLLIVYSMKLSIGVWIYQAWRSLEIVWFQWKHGYQNEKTSHDHVVVSNTVCLYVQMFNPTWRNYPIWLIFFRWVGSTTN